MMMVRMLTGLLSLLWRRKKPDTDAIFRAGRNAGLEEASALAEAAQSPDRESHGVFGRRGMPEDRARFIAAFLKRAFLGRTAISIFCHEDKPFPDVHAGGEIEGINVYGSGDDWKLTFVLNHYVFFVDGDVDIELESNAPMLRVSSAAPCGAKIQLVFMPEGGYGPIPDYDLWVKSRRALDDCEYFEFAGDTP